MSHADTAIALAEKGFIVVAPTHPNDTFQATSDIEKWLLNRSRHLQRTIDAALTTWKDRRHVDPDRIGLFGFSAGATTALIQHWGQTRPGPHMEPMCFPARVYLPDDVTAGLQESSFEVLAG